MFIDNECYYHDLSIISKRFPKELFQDKRFLITGASGMLCSCVVDLLMCTDIDVSVIARNRQHLEHRFRRYHKKANFHIIHLDIISKLHLTDQFDYIIHGASNADPISFTKYPVDTLLSNVLGTQNLLEYGLSHSMERFLYISSGEMYGQPDELFNDFTEDYCGYIDYSSPRTCYPSGKRAAEVLCQSYISQYNVDAVIVRPCHIFGPTMTANDSRAVSEFLSQAAAGNTIVMKSSGLIERSHCYVNDAAEAILRVLIDGICGQAYNIADKKYQMTIRKFAEEAAKAGSVNVVFQDPNDLEIQGYSKIIRSVLDSKKLENLGWLPEMHESNAIQKTIQFLR